MDNNAKCINFQNSSTNINMMLYNYRLPRHNRS